MSKFHKVVANHKVATVSPVVAVQSLPIIPKPALTPKQNNSKAS